MLPVPPGRLLTQGRGLPTALIHGVLGSWSFWNTALPRRLAAGRTLCYPLPGHYPWTGRGHLVQPILTPHVLAKAYATALQRDFPGRPVHLVGHSAGAFVALMIAALHPGLVDRLTLVAGFYDGRIAGTRPYMRNLLTGGGLSRSVLKAALHAWTASPAPFRAGLATVMFDGRALARDPEHRGQCEALRRDLRRSDFDGLLATARWVLGARLGDELRLVRQRTLVVAGRCDGVIPLEHQCRLAAMLPNARLAILDATGHLPMAEQFAGFCAQVRGFCD